MRRVGQMLRLGEVVLPDAKAMYIDYSIAKAAGQDLSRFKPRNEHATGQSAEDGQGNPVPDSV